jgi:molybdopterin molybdotransferase
MARPDVARAPSCDDGIESDLVPVDEALKRIDELVRPLEDVEQIPVRDGLDRVLAAAVVSPFDVPSHTNSAMDGYALRGEDLAPESVTELALLGTAWAGRPWTGAVAAGQCVRIFTGAAMPAGTDTVVMQEHAESDGVTVAVAGGQRRGQNVRQAGEDIRAGATVLEPGRRLTPADLGVIASLGVGEIRVVRRPRVAFFSNGDELRSLGQPLGPGDIYDSNRYTLHAMLTRAGCELLDLGVVGDDPGAIEEAFRRGAGMADMLVTSAGASVGEADYVKQTLDRVGEVSFWKLAMKPGRPLAFGRVGKAWFFGLPGNPVSVMVTFSQFVTPALRRLAGERSWRPLRMRARTTSALRKKAGRTEFQRGVLEAGADGDLTVTSTGGQGSGILSSMSRANCFIILPVDSDRVAAGDWVTVEPFAGLL